jgi:hypothetical protein
MLGSAKGLFDLFPDRFKEDGTELNTCHDIKGVTVWGDALCATTISAFETALKIGTLPLYTDKVKANAAVSCHISDDPALGLETTLEKCTLATFDNGIMQWRYKTGVSCTNPLDFKLYIGTENCINRGTGNVWDYAGAYIS